VALEEEDDARVLFDNPRLTAFVREVDAGKIFDYTSLELADKAAVAGKTGLG
jgi:hypothetical protein